MKKAVLVLEGVTDEELRDALSNEAVLTLLTYIAVKYGLAAFIGAGQSVPSDVYHRLKDPVYCSPN